MLVFPLFIIFSILLVSFRLNSSNSKTGKLFKQPDSRVEVERFDDVEQIPEYFETSRTNIHEGKKVPPPLLAFGGSLGSSSVVVSPSGNFQQF